jgi:hypothetical protein
MLTFRVTWSPTSSAKSLVSANSWSVCEPGAKIENSGYGTGEISMSGRNKAARAFVILGSVVLFASAALHFFGGYTQIFPLYAASNLSPRLKEAFRVVFLSLGWHWVVTAVVALLAGVTETRLRKVLLLTCGLAVLIEAAVAVSMMGFFIGNELIGTAALLLVCGGLLFDQAAGKSVSQVNEQLG